MNDTTEYNRLVNEKANAQNQLNDTMREMDVIQDKIDRLETAKRTLSNEYNSFSDVRKTVKSNVRDDYDWKGSKYNQFSEHGSDLMSAYKTYYKNLDDARDEINLEIMRLENQLYRQEGFMGHLRSLINSLDHSIENLFNDYY